MIGTSAGGVEALANLVTFLPKDLDAAILVVIHVPQSSTSYLPEILNRKGGLPAKHAKDGERISPGQVYIAPPGRHMLLEGNIIRLNSGPRENASRPAIDPLFRSAAKSKHACLVSVLLSGMLDDGTLGTSAVKLRGGITLVQDPNEAPFGDMPRNAIKTGCVDEILTIEDIARRLVELVGSECRPAESEGAKDPVEMNVPELATMEAMGKPSQFVCPECHGTLFELKEDGILHYRCRVGHSFLPDSLSSSQEVALEAALWSAVRALKEHIDLLQSMLDSARQRGYENSAKNYEMKIEASKKRLGALTTALPFGKNATEAADLP